MRRLIILTFLLLLPHSFATVASGQEEPPQPPEAKLLRVFDGRCKGYECGQEYLYYLFQENRTDVGTFVVCVRSDRPLALAFADSNLNLPAIPSIVTDLYSSSNPVLFLRRSERQEHTKRSSFPRDTPGYEPRISGEVTELWFVPKGAALPPHTDAVHPCRFSRTYFSEELSFSRRLRLMAVELRKRPDSFGIVEKYFNEKRYSLARLKARVRRILKAYGIRPDRVLVAPNQSEVGQAYVDVAIAEVLPECPEKK